MIDTSWVLTYQVMRLYAICFEFVYQLKEMHMSCIKGLGTYLPTLSNI